MAPAAAVTHPRCEQVLMIRTQLAQLHLGGRCLLLRLVSAQQRSKKQEI